MFHHFRGVEDQLLQIKYEYNGRSSKPFIFILYNPFFQETKGIAELNEKQAEKVLTKLRKYEKMPEIRSLKTWIATMIQKHHR